MNINKDNEMASKIVSYNVYNTKGMEYKLIMGSSFS